MNSVLRNIIRFIFFILLQVYILDNVPALHRFIIPVIYFLFRQDRRALGNFSLKFFLAEKCTSKSSETDFIDE